MAKQQLCTAHCTALMLSPTLTPNAMQTQHPSVSTCKPPVEADSVSITHQSVPAVTSDDREHVPAPVCVQKHITASLSEPVHCIAKQQIHCSRRSFDPRSPSEPVIQLRIIPNSLARERERDFLDAPRCVSGRHNNTDVWSLPVIVPAARAAAPLSDERLMASHSSRDDGCGSVLKTAAEFPHCAKRPNLSSIHFRDPAENRIPLQSVRSNYAGVQKNVLL